MREKRIYHSTRSQRQQRPGLLRPAKGQLCMALDDQLVRENCKFEVSYPVAKGPDGRKSMFNGLADSIWIGSKHKAEAWKWVKFLGLLKPKDCRQLRRGFPAVRGDVDTAKELLPREWMSLRLLKKEPI
jgi:hypothetical protein